MAAVIDLNGIKNDLKTLFDTANTIGASPVDLSNNMSQRVKKVLTVHPDFIRPQASFFPFVTCYIISKTIVRDDIAKDQLSAKREAEIDFEVVGGVFNQNMTDATKDPADQDINYLMENVELILRSNYNINTKIKWQRPESVSYYSLPLDATNHIRAGVLKIRAKVFY